MAYCTQKIKKKKIQNKWKQNKESIGKTQECEAELLSINS